jgi:hypothetical protein
LPSLANPFSGQDVHWTSRLIRFTHAVDTPDKHHPDPDYVLDGLHHSASMASRIYFQRGRA